jgi:hypothetical protein
LSLPQTCASPEPVSTPANVWSDADEELAAIAEYEGGAPRVWAEALARLDPARPSGDVPPGRWVRFIDDYGRFVDDGWAHRAEGQISAAFTYFYKAFVATAAAGRSDSSMNCPMAPRDVTTST